MSYDVIVIGAGHNGLTTASILARAGRSVLVLEARDTIGGLAGSQEFAPGYRTTGVLHDDSGVSNSAFEMLGLADFGLRRRKNPVPVFAPQTDGPGLLLHRDPEAARDEIKAHSPKDANSYARYRGFLNKLSPIIRKLVQSAPPSPESAQLGDLVKMASTGLELRKLGPDMMMDVLRIAPMCSADWLREWFETELLSATLTAPAVIGTWMGPWSSGSNATLLLRECTARDGFEGGPAALVKALAKAARAHGAEIRTGARVKSLRMVGDIATSVILESGETIDTDVIAASCDPRHTLIDLVNPRLIPPLLDDEIQRWRGRGTTAKVHLALSGPLDFASRPGESFEHVHIGESIDDVERAFDAVKYGEFSKSPTLDIRIPTVSEVGLAPEGHHVASIVVSFAPFHLKGGWDGAQRDALGQTVIDTLARYAPGLKDQIVAQQVLTPADLSDQYGLVEGHIHHGEHALDQLLFMRPGPMTGHYRTPIDGLYLCGSGSHPGGGVTCGPGALAASAILKD